MVVSSSMQMLRKVMCSRQMTSNQKGLFTIWNVSRKTLWTYSRLIKVTFFIKVHDFIYSNPYLYHSDGKVNLTKPHHLVNLIAKCLNCTHLEAEEFCTQLPQDMKIDLKIAENHLNLLKDVGIDSRVLFDNPWLMYQSSKTINYRISLLKGVGLEINDDTIPLMKLSDARLSNAVKRWHLDEQFLINTHCKNRLVYLARHLNCPIADIAAAMTIHQPLLTFEFGRLKRVLDSLLQHNISPKDILKDLWIFNCKEDVIMARLQRAAAVGVNPIKTWRLRCTENEFDNFLQKWNDNKDVRGFEEDPKDPVSYLAERLSCDKEDVVRLSRKYPKLLSVKFPKVKQVLDFIFSKGYTPDDVCRAPRVLSHSITTLQTRLEELNKLGYTPTHLSVLFSTAKIYERIIDKLRQRQKT